MKTKFQSTLIRSALLLLLSAAGASAASMSINGLTWQTYGDVAASGNGVILTTAYSDGMDDAISLNVSGTNPLLAGGPLETALGKTAGSFDLDNLLRQVSEGSAISRSFTVQAGDVISFDWQLRTMETSGNDYAFLLISGQPNSTLGDVASATQAGTLGYTSQTGVTHFTHAFTSAGTYTVSFGVVDVADASITTSLAVSNISVGAVPEPSSAVLGVIGLAAALFYRRRKA